MTSQDICNSEWLDNMEKIRFKWNTTYIDMDYYGSLFMPEEMGFIYWKLGRPDGQLPYQDRKGVKQHC